VATQTDIALLQLVTIGGLGEYGTNSIYPLAFASSLAMQPAGSPYVYRARVALETVTTTGNPHTVSRITTPSSSVSPVRGDPEQGTFSFELVLDDADEELCAWFAPADVLPVANAIADFGPTDVVIQVAPGQVAASGIVANSIIYWDREAFRVEVVDAGADTIKVMDLIPGGSRTGDGAIGRLGQIGTYMEQHYGRTDGEQPPYRDSRIFLRPPAIRDVPVQVLASLNGAAEDTIAFGWIESVAFNADGGTVEVVARGPLAALSDQKVNSSVPAFNWQSGWFVDGRDFGGESFVVRVAVDDPTSSALLTNGGGLIRFGDSIYYVTGTAWYPNSSAWSFTFTYSNALGALSTGYRISIAAGTVGSEVLATNPAYYTDPTLSPFYDPDAAEIPTNPIHILRQFLGTKPSQLPVTWRAFIPAAAVNDDDLVRLAETVYSGWDWRGVLVVCDGTSESFLEFLTRTFARPLGASFAADSAGRFTMRSLWDQADTSAPEIDGAYPLDGRGVGFDLEAMTDALRVTTAINAAGEPMATVFGAGAYRSRFTISRATNVVDMTADGLMPLPDFAGVQMLAIQAYGARLARLAAMFRLRPQIVTLRLLMTADVQPGQFRRFAITGLRSPITGRLEVTPSSRIGLVVSVANDYRFAMATVDVLMFATRYKRIGPAARVASGGDDEDVNVDAFTYVAPTPYNYAPDSGGSVSEDAETFVVGDVVVCRDSHLEVLTDPTVVSAVSAGVVTVTPGFTDPGGGPTYVPVAGDVLTYADLGDCVEAQTAEFAFFGVDRLGI